MIDAIKSAVRAACEGRNVSPEARFDLQQDIALKLLEQSEQPANQEAWIRTVAKNLVAEFVRTEATHREILESVRQLGTQTKRTPKRDPMVNYMAVKPVLRTTGANDVEDAMIAWVDARSRSQDGPEFVPTCQQDLVAVVYTVSHNSTSSMQIVGLRTLARSSSL